MKWFFNPCSRHRQNIALLASGALPESEKDRLGNHFAGCADCQRYYDQLIAVTTTLADPLASLAHVRPTQAAKDRWANAVQAAARPKAVHPGPETSGLGEWWRDVIWPYRRVWAGLAAVWVLILAGNLSLRDQTPAFAAKSSPPTKEIMMAFKDQQAVLNELLADHSAPRDADRPKLNLPKPRTEHTRVLSA